MSDAAREAISFFIIGVGVAELLILISFFREFNVLHRQLKKLDQEILQIKSKKG